MADLIVRGNVSGRTLAAAMIKAHAATRGSLQERQLAGVGRFKQYLGANTVRQEAWERQTSLGPEAVLARASLATVDLAAAEQFLEAATDVEQRRALLGQIVSLHYTSSTRLFGRPIGEPQPVAQAVEASELEPGLQPQLPAQELVMIKNPGEGEGRESISQDQVTNAQYGIFIAQTGHRAPCYWDDANLGRQNPNAGVVGVDYSSDAVGFTRWLGRRVPTKADFLRAEERRILTTDKPWEWMADNEGLQVYPSLRKEGRDCYRPDCWAGRRLAFRVAEG